MTLYWLVHGGFENGLWVIIIPLNSNVSKNRQPLSIHQFKPHIFTSFPIPLMLNTPTPGWVLGSHGRWLKKSVMKDTFSTQILRQTSNSLASARRRAARASKTLKARKASFPSFPWRKMGEKMPRWSGPFGTCLEERTNIFRNPRFWMCFIIFQQQNGCCHCPTQFQPNLLAGSRTTFGLSKADRLTEKFVKLLQVLLLLGTFSRRTADRPLWNVLRHQGTLGKNGTAAQGQQRDATNATILSLIHHPPSCLHRVWCAKIETHTIFKICSFPFHTMSFGNHWSGMSS